MVFYCLKHRDKTAGKNLRVEKTNKGRLMILSKCAVCDSKKSLFIKEQEASQLKTPLSKIPILCNILL